MIPADEALVPDHRASVAFHCSVVAGQKLRPDHALHLVLRCDADERINNREAELISVCSVAVLQPDGIDSLVHEHVVPIVGHRTADWLQLSKLHCRSLTAST